MRTLRIFLASAVCLMLVSPSARADLLVEDRPDPVLVGAGIALCVAVVLFGLYLAKRRKAKGKASSSEVSDSK